MNQICNRVYTVTAKQVAAAAKVHYAEWFGRKDIVSLEDFTLAIQYWRAING